MKILTTNADELDIENSWRDECPNCGETDVDMYFIPNWMAHRCYGCLMNEAKKFHYTIIECKYLS
jgi:hypothetical protein